MRSFTAMLFQLGEYEAYEAELKKIADINELRQAY